MSGNTQPIAEMQTETRLEDLRRRLVEKYGRLIDDIEQCRRERAQDRRNMEALRRIFRNERE